MSYTVTKKSQKDATTVTVRTKEASKLTSKEGFKWWKAASKAGRGQQAVATAVFLRSAQQNRNRQNALYARMYANQPLAGVWGTPLEKTASQTANSVMDRPTMNVVQSCIDTLVSRLTQNRPRPVFLTDNGNSTQRALAKQFNSFIGGEFYRTEAYELGRLIMRDSGVMGTGILKVHEEHGKVALTRILASELLVDPVDAAFGNPRTLYQVALVDRDVLMERFPDHEKAIARAESGSPYDSQNYQSAADQVLVVEAWHLPSGPDAGDGMRVISCSEGPLLEEAYEEDTFPFVFLHYSPRILGFFGQGLAEQLMGTQVEINKLLITISRSLNTVGVPKVLIADGSKIVKAHLNDQIGAIVTYQGIKPEWTTPVSIQPEMYAQLQRLVDYAYQQSGISQLSAASKKPQGLNSGAALREYDDLQSDRFATLEKAYERFYIDLAYKVLHCASKIAKRDGKYTTVYPSKHGIEQVALPKADLVKDTYVIQCFAASSLPRDPSGRLAKVTELVQAGMIDIREGRRLMDFPDLQQEERLANAAEERILKVLDGIVDNAKPAAVDPFMDAGLAVKLSTQYYNLYEGNGLSEERAALLRAFHTQAVAAVAAANPQVPQASPGMPGAPTPGGTSPQLAQAEPLPTSPLIPQGA